MLTLSNVSMSFNGKTLFSQAGFRVDRRDRLALVGPNGAGKSTLFSIILGEQLPDEGLVELERGGTLGFLPQESAPVGEETVLELATAITPAHAKWRRALTEAAQRGETETDAALDAQAHYADLGGFQLDPQAKRILKGLAFKEADFDRPAHELSGGWVMRAHLARLLVMAPDLLMLDEPTNHLDLETLGWFQNYLRSYPGALLMISHDRAFINELVDGILEISRRQIRRYTGNFDQYLEQKKAREEQHAAAYKNQQREIAGLQRFADRFRAKASKASQAQSKLRQIERMEKIEAPESDEKTIKIRFPQPPRSGRKVIELTGIHHAYGKHVVYQGVDFMAERRQRIVLVGPNGAGKSTLLKLLGGVLEVQQGVRQLGHQVKTGYYSQNRIDTLDPGRTVLEEVMSIETPVPEVTARTVLGAFLFSGDDVFKSVGVLSGGEKSRLSLVKLLLDPPNLLLMDEPTTHLDLASIDALVEALAQFEGTLVFISHDVYFIRALAGNVLHIDQGRLTYYAGDYDYYLDRSRATSAREGLTAGQGKMTDQRPPAANGKTATAKPASVFKTKEQKRREARERQARSDRRKKAEARLAELEPEIMRLEERQQEITAQMEDPKLYAAGGDVMQLNRELLELTESLKKLNKEWAETGRILEELQTPTRRSRSQGAV